MGEKTGKPGPDPKTPLEKAAVPPPYRRGGASGSPLVELAKEQAKQIKGWMKEITEP